MNCLPKIVSLLLVLSSLSAATEQDTKDERSSQLSGDNEEDRYGNSDFEDCQEDLNRDLRQNGTFWGYVTIPAKIGLWRGNGIRAAILFGMLCPKAIKPVNAIDVFGYISIAAIGVPVVLGGVWGSYGAGLYTYDSLVGYCYNAKNRLGV